MRTRMVLALWLVMAPAVMFFPRPVESGQEPADRIAVILIIDNSGSMKASDPDDLRFTAVRLFTSLLDVGDQVGWILFSTQSNELTNGLVTLRSEADRHALLAQARFTPPEGYTDIQAALLDARDMLRNAQGTMGKTAVVLLTDGKPEIPLPRAAYEQETLGVARSLEVPVLSIALTTAAQTPFLNLLASQTGGLVVPANSAADLLDAYLEVFSQIKDRTVMGSGVTESPGDVKLEIEPALAPYITKASFVLSKPAVVQAEFLEPGNGKITAESLGVLSFLSDDPRFTVITIEQPAGGEWKFRVTGKGSVMGRVILHSRLRARITSPARFHQAGQAMPIVVHLTEEIGAEIVKIIGEASFSASITRPDGAQESLDRFYDDGTHGDDLANDGNFTRLYVNTQQPGVYTLRIEGRKGVIPVEQTAQVDVIPFPRLVIDEPVGVYEIKGQPLPLRVHLEGGTPAILDSGIMQARIISPSGRITETTLQEEQGRYTGAFLPMEDGEYQVTYQTQGAVYWGVSYQLEGHGQFHVHLVRLITVDVSRTTRVSACLANKIVLPLAATVESAQTEPVEFGLSGSDDWILEPARFELPPGNHALTLTLTPGKRRLVSGGQPVTLVVSGESGSEIQPGVTIPLQIIVPSVWVRCRQPIGWSAAAGMGIIFIALVIGLRARAANRPPNVSGTLRYWPAEEDHSKTTEVDLTAFRKPALTIGSDSANEIAVPKSGLAAQHAVLKAVTSSTGVQVMLEPYGEIHKGYVTLNAPTALQHGDEFIMGALVFQYLSDTGE